MRVLYATARRGRIIDVEWFLLVDADVQISRTRCTRLYERVQLTEHVIQGGVPAMRAALLRQNDERLLIWTDAMLAYAVRCHGGCQQRSSLSSTAMEWWTLALKLCGGWNQKALIAAVRYACPDVIHVISSHPDAVMNTSGLWHTLMEMATHQKNDAVYNLLMQPHYNPLDLTWGHAEEAAKKHNHLFLRWFFSNARPHVLGDFGARRCIEAAIVRPYSPDPLGILKTMELFMDCGQFVQYDEELLLMAIGHTSGMAVVNYILEQMNRLHVHVRDPSRI